MSPEQALTRLLAAYETYYDVSRCEPPQPFAARAVFHSHGEKYVLVRQAKIWEQDSHEYVFVHVAQRLSAGDLPALVETAWREGLSQVRPSFSHRNSDVVLILLARHIADEALDAVSRLPKSRGYFCSLKGWSELRVAAHELSSGKLSANRRGRDLRQLLNKIY